MKLFGPLRGLVVSAHVLGLLGCSGSPPPPARAQPDATEIDLSKPAPDRPAWPVGLVPCAKDAPEGTGCAVRPAPGAAERPEESPDTAEKVWHVSVGPDDPVKGADDALVTLVVFSDFECPFCKRFTTTTDRLLSELPREVRIVWKDLPLPSHPHAEAAAELARFARRAQGDAGFWKAHDLLYASQESLGDATFRQIIGRLGLPFSPAWSAIREARFGSVIQADVAESDSVLVEATPTLFVNGVKLVGAQPYERTRALVDAELSKAKAMVAAGTPVKSLYDSIVSKGVRVEPRTDTQLP